MGEKFIEWSDNRFPLSLNTILSMTSFYWFTNSFGRGLWGYSFDTSRIPVPFSLTKPFGYSSYPIEIAALPKAWAEHLYPNLVFYRTHDKGGHFAALEQPELFFQDLEDFMALVAPNVTRSQEDS
jgi:microsomal epoxide hydrolase